jgi:hypothetical protein
LAREEARGQVFGRVCNQTKLFSRSKPGPLACYPDPFPILAGTTVQFQPSQIPTVLCPVRVTHSPRQSWSGMWLGVKPNRTELLFKTPTACVFPRPCANTAVIATGQGNPASDLIRTSKIGWSSSKPVKYRTFCLGAGEPWTCSHLPAGFARWGLPYWFQSPVLVFGFSIHGHIQTLYR